MYIMRYFLAKVGWAIDKHTSMDEFQKHHHEWKKSEEKRVQILSLFIYNFRNYKLICKDTKQISGCQGMRVEDRSRLQDRFGIDGNVYFHCVMTSGVYTYVNIH